MTMALASSQSEETFVHRRYRGSPASAVLISAVPGLVQFTNFWPVTYLYGSTYNLVVLAVTPFLLSLWLY